jgi:hypothetical protein
MTEIPVTWAQIARVQPEFVQWIVQKYGPLPDGPVVKSLFDHYAELYKEAHDD